MSIFNKIRNYKYLGPVLFTYVVLLVIAAYTFITTENKEHLGDIALVLVFMAVLLPIYLFIMDKTEEYYFKILDEIYWRSGRSPDKREKFIDSFLIRITSEIIIKLVPILSILFIVFIAFALT